MKPLSEVQSWVQRFITTPELDLGIADQAALMVLPSKTLSAEERIGIYRGMYLPRLLEALEPDYPGVLHYLGRQRFEEVATDYLQTNPSKSYTLNRLGDNFPRFLIGFAAQLAKLELAITQVFDEVECPVLTPADVAAVPEQAWETAVLLPIAAMRLLTFPNSVSEYLAALQDDSAPVPIVRKRTYVVVYRRDYHVHRLSLNGTAFELLTSLCAGTPIAVACAGCRLPGEDIFEYFREWTAAGLFQKIQLR